MTAAMVEDFRIEDDGAGKAYRTCPRCGAIGVPCRAGDFFTMWKHVAGQQFDRREVARNVNMCSMTDVWDFQLRDAGLMYVAPRDGQPYRYLTNAEIRERAERERVQAAEDSAHAAGRLF